MNQMINIIGLKWKSTGKQLFVKLISKDIEDKQFTVTTRKNNYMLKYTYWYLSVFSSNEKYS